MSGIQALLELVPQGPLAGPVGDAVAEMQTEIIVAFSTAEHLHHSKLSPQCPAFAKASIFSHNYRDALWDQLTELCIAHEVLEPYTHKLTAEAR